MQQPQQVPDAFRVTAESYPVLTRWLHLSAKDFQEELAEIGSIGREVEAAEVKAAVASAVTALESLYRQRSSITASS